MTERKKRKIYSPEFKAKVGIEALKGLKTVNEIGQAYGVHPAQVGKWKKAIQDNAAQLFEGKRGPKPVAEHRQPDKLYSEIGRLKMELDWLKKSPGSACHEAPQLDKNGTAACSDPSVRVGGYLPINGLCLA